VTLASCPPRPVASRGVSSADPVDLHFVHRGHGAEFEMEVAWIRSRVPEEARRVLDVGCGNGALFEALGKDRTLGLDTCRQGLARTRSRYAGTQLVCGDAARPPLADRSVDVVTAQHVLEHLDAYETACREWYRVLRPGGLLLVLTPNVRFIDPGVFEDATHVHLFDGDDLASTLSGSGFEIHELYTLGLPWFRSYRRLPSGWRFRRLVTRRSSMLGRVPLLRWRGQTLCCAARRPQS